MSQFLFLVLTLKSSCKHAKLLFLSPIWAWKQFICCNSSWEAPPAEFVDFPKRKEVVVWFMTFLPSSFKRPPHLEKCTKLTSIFRIHLVYSDFFFSICIYSIIHKLPRLIIGEYSQDTFLGKDALTLFPNPLSSQAAFKMITFSWLCVHNFLSNESWLILSMLN